MAFMLLVLMTAAAFATSRNLARELAVGGDAWQGARAASAAESGLAWFLAWSAGEGLRPLLARLEAGAVGEDGRLPGLPEGLEAGTGESALRVGFSLRIRRLGALPRPAPASGDPPMAPDQLWQVTATGHCAVLGQGGDPAGFTQVRELLFTAPAAADPGAPEQSAAAGDAPPWGIRIQAWRTAPAG